MKRLLILAVLAAAGWYGYKNWEALTHRAPGHEAVIRNQTGHTMERVRLTVDGQTMVRETIASGEEARLEFKVAHDATFNLEWNYTEAAGTHSWTGGTIPKGPIIQRHVMTVDEDNGVLVHSEARIMPGTS